MVVTSATLRTLNSFQRLQEMSDLSEKAGDRFISLDSPFNHVTQGKLVISQMKYEPVLANEVMHLAEMVYFFSPVDQKGAAQGDSGAVRQQSGDAAVYRLSGRAATDMLVGLQPFAEGLDLKGDLLS